MSVLINPHRFGAGAGGPSNVKELLHFDGTDGSTTITQSAPAGGSWTANGDAQIDTAQSKFGGASLLLDGAGDYIRREEWESIGSQAFCLEMWIRPASVASQMSLVGSWETFQNRREFLFDMTSAQLRFILSPDGSNANVKTAATTFAVNTWYHVAVSRDALDVLRFFRDGVELAEHTGFSTVGYTAGPHAEIGGRIASGGLSDPFNGWIDDFRYTLGEPVYTANFTPPASAHPDP